MKETIPCLTCGSAAMGVSAVKGRPRSEFWLMRLATEWDPAPPRISATWDDVRQLVAHCLTRDDVWAVFSHLGATKIERQRLPDGGYVFKAQTVPVADVQISFF